LSARSGGRNKEFYRRRSALRSSGKRRAAPLGGPRKPRKTGTRGRRGADPPLDHLKTSSGLVDVLETLDVVLTEIASGLNLDQFERDFPFIRQPMNAADRDVDRFIFMYRTDALADRDFGSTSHDDPMFGAMTMLLQ